MALIRSIGEIAKKWKDVTPARADIYRANVAAPLKDWEKETVAAGDRQKEGMRKAMDEDRIVKGVVRAGLAKWSKMTTTKGPSRWVEGVGIAEPEYTAGFGPYRDVIEKTDPGPRYSKGDPRNWERSKKIGLALHAKKISG